MQELQTPSLFSGLVATIFNVAVVVFFLILLFAVRRIRLEAILINKRLRTLNTILREVHKEVLPSQTCQQCQSAAPFGQNNCTHCGAELAW
jgi:uncharacterized membrane protein YciS (DUF1049 family)